MRRARWRHTKPLRHELSKPAAALFAVLGFAVLLEFEDSARALEDRRGRHRYKAAIEVGIEPTFAEWDGARHDGNPFRFVWQIHDARRHWVSAVQRQMVWEDAEEHARQWEAERERIHAEANASRSEKVAEQPRQAGGKFAEKPAVDGTNSPTNGANAVHKARKAKAQAAGTNEGAVKVSDILPENVRRVSVVCVAIEHRGQHMSTYVPPYARQHEPVASTRDYARALMSGELFRAWSGERIGQTLDPIVEDIMQSQMPLHRVLARAVGLPEGLTAGEVYSRMIGVGDLAALIVPGRVELIQSQFSPWVARFMKLFKRVPVPNFLDHTFHSLGVSSPQSMTEFAEFKFGTVSTPTALETIGLTSNGIAWLMSRHVLINGNTQLIDTMEAQIAAVFAAYLRSALATALAATDTLEDGSAFFNSGAGNLVSTGSGGLPSVTTLDTATKMMATQTLPGGQRCGLIPRFIVTPPLYAGTAAVLARAVYEDSSPTPFEVIVVPELAEDYVYYVADPVLSPTLALLTLGNSDRLLNVETFRPQFAVDGIAMRATMDFRIARASRTGIVKYAVA